jgi:hypothetical protein
MINNTVYFDSGMTDEQRRPLLYQGQLFMFSPTPSTLALKDFAYEMICEAFAPHDPLTAQYDMPVERFVEIFGPLKPRFMHHPRTRDLLRQVLTDLRCDLDQTYLDVPRFRGVTSHGYLTSGVGFAHHPHRDTWWAAPLAQLNWWMPLVDIASESSMAFHPRYFEEGVVNHSEEFNYYDWNAVGRAEAAKHITSDTRRQPKPDPDIPLDPQVRLVGRPGSVIAFAAAQMHSTVPNTTGTTRFSIDFRTVNVADLRAGLGVRNVDSHPTGTSLRDFRRASDDADMPDEVVARYDSGSKPADGILVFGPGQA